MNFLIKTDNFKNAINKVERIVTKQTTLPILGNILIKAEKGRVIIASTNLEIAVKTIIGAKINKEGSITIPARIISGFLNGINEEEIKISLKDLNLKLSTLKHNIIITGMDPEEFPIIPDNPKEYLIKTPKISKLNKAISATLTSAAKNDSRQELNGIYLEFKKNKIILASTDSYRLTEVIINLNKEEINKKYYEVFIQENPSIIIPALTFMELQRILTKGEIEINIKDNQLFIKNNETYVISRLISGNYPEYKQIIPAEYKTSLKIKKQELLSALKVNSLFLNNLNNEIKIKSEKNKIIISSQSEGVGKNISKVDIQKEGEDFEIILNCRYLMEGLNIFNEDEGGMIVIKVNNQKTPVLIQEIRKGKIIREFSYIVMPIIKD